MGRISFSSNNNGQDGNIKIVNSDLLLMRNDSLISTVSASNSIRGRGGDIRIDTPFLIALPGNNDISANAYRGGESSIDIDNNTRTFNIQYRRQGQASPLTNDITTDGTFSQTEILSYDQIARGVQLPNVPTDASNQIAQTCNASRENKFIIAGRGGMPPNGDEPLTSDVVWQDPRATNSQPAANSTTNNPPKYPPPAVGLVFDGKGKAFLVAAATQGQPTGTNATCPQAKEQFRIRDRETEEFRIRD